MSELLLLTNDDEVFADLITGSAFDYLQDASIPGLPLGAPKNPASVGVRGACSEVSDAVTRAAHDLSVTASREFHRGHHFITSFAPLDQLPSEDDVIMCLTWGQFNHATYAQQPKPFFGARNSIKPWVGTEAYADCFSAESVELRQTTNTRPSMPWMEHVWLKTKPDDIASGSYPVGTIDPTTYTLSDWQYPHRVQV